MRQGGDRHPDGILTTSFVPLHPCRVSLDVFQSHLRVGRSHQRRSHELRIHGWQKRLFSGLP